MHPLQRAASDTHEMIVEALKPCIVNSYILADRSRVPFDILFYGVFSLHCVVTRKGAIEVASQASQIEEVLQSIVIIVKPPTA